MPTRCPHGVDLVNFNCETCARDHAAAIPQDREPWPDQPTFTVHREGLEWVCVLGGYAGRGQTVGRAIDAAITTGLGLGRSRSLKAWLDSRRFVVTPEPEATT